MLAREGPHGPVIHAANAAATALGLSRGARVTDMRALVPHLRVEAADQTADAADLERLARWCRRWCPWVRSEGADGLLLDTTGADHLWGGEAAMLADMRRAFAGLGLSTRSAAAPTIGSAWALARFGKTPCGTCGPEALAETLAPLPAAALRLDDETLRMLNRLGLKTVGALAAVPRLALARRFRRERNAAANPVLRLDQAMGRAAEPLVAGRPAPPLRAVRTLVEPVGEVESVACVLAELMRDLTGRMTERHAGARRLRLTGYRVDGGASWVEAATGRASRDAAHLTRLFDGKLDTLDPGFGFEAMTLEITGAEELASAQQPLSGIKHGREDDGIDLACLIDRLLARLGAGAVRRPAAGGSHIPERAEALQPAHRNVPKGAPAPGTAGTPLPRAPRPLRLLRPPEQAEVLYAVPDGPPARFIWRRQTHTISRSEGPERIAPEWWREKPAARLRDYYRIEDSEGRRYWIYREGVSGDGRGGPPAWFVHGLDA